MRLIGQLLRLPIFYNSLQLAGAIYGSRVNLGQDHQGDFYGTAAPLLGAAQKSLRQKAGRQLYIPGLRLLPLFSPSPINDLPFTFLFGKFVLRMLASNQKTYTRA